VMSFPAGSKRFWKLDAVSAAYTFKSVCIGGKVSRSKLI
jgi:hypothetical protein